MLGAKYVDNLCYALHGIADQLFVVVVFLCVCLFPRVQPPSYK